MMKSRRHVLTVLSLVPFAGLIGNAYAQTPQGKPAEATPKIGGAAPAIEPGQAPLPSANASVDEIERFCGNIDSQAADARFELQSQQLVQLRSQIDERIKVLEEKRKEYETWLVRRNEFLDKAQDSLVAIISKMNPSAAAAQLALVDDVAAAAIILKLTPRVSSAIMNELPPEKSANLTRVLVSVQHVPAGKPLPSKAAEATQ